MSGHSCEFRPYPSVWGTVVSRELLRAVRCFLVRLARCLPLCPSTYNIRGVHRSPMVLLSAIAKEESMGLSLRLRGGGAPDSKGKGACMQQQRRTPA